MARRSGFTLIELLVVVVIMGLLLALLVTAGFAVIGTSREAATKATVRIIDSILSNRVAAAEIANADSPVFYEQVVFINSLRKQAAAHPTTGSRITTIANAIDSRISTFAGTVQPAQRALVKKEFMRIHFPQTWEEADYLLAINDKPAIASDPLSETESAEVLYFVLTAGKVPGSAQIDQQAIPSGAIRDTDGNGRFEIVDGWNHPVRFYRWPTRLLRNGGLPANYVPRGSSVNIPAIDPGDRAAAQLLMPIPTSDETRDVLDPNGISINKAISDSSISANDTSADVTAYENAYHLPATYCVHLVVSAGADGEFGLENPGNAASFGKWCKVSFTKAVYDNITGRQP